MKPPLPQSSSPQPDILPSLFASPSHRDPRTFALSVLLHISAAVVVGLMLHHAVSESRIAVNSPFTAVSLSSAILSPFSHHGSGGPSTGGGREELTLASKGVPPPVSVRPLMNVTTHVPDDPPALVVPQSLPNSIPMVLAGPIGDPRGVLGPTSDGPGKGRGIGDGDNEGIGRGREAAWSPYQAGRGGVSVPRILYDPEPEYTEEARKVKQQGSVILACVVGTDGKVHNARVQRPLGLGLDEKAIEAVRRWKFEPSRLNGQPVAVQILVEVNFHLY